MPKIIKTTVDADGNVQLDFCGFVGNECVGEEQRMRDELAHLGLYIAPKAKKSKAAADESRALNGRRLII